MTARMAASLSLSAWVTKIVLAFASHFEAGVAEIGADDFGSGLGGGDGGF
jgi:hypothetical protein